MWPLVLILCVMTAGDDSPQPLGPMVGTAVAVSPDPNDPDGVLLLDQERGLMRSIDGGRTYSPYGMPLPGASAASQMALARVPGSSGQLFAFIAGELFVTADGGMTWQLRNGSMPNLFEDMDVANDGQLVLLLRPSGDIWRSVDGGETFDVLPAEYDALTIAPSDASRVYAGDLSSSAPIAFGRSDDGGQTFVPVAPEVRMIALAVHPDDSDVVLVSGLTGPEGHGVYLSVDGGETASLVFDEPAQQIAWSLDGRRAMLTHEQFNDVTFYESTDVGVSFLPITDGMPDLEEPRDLAYACDGDVVGVFGPSSGLDGGVTLREGGGTTTEVGVPDGLVDEVAALGGVRVAVAALTDILLLGSTGQYGPLPQLLLPLDGPWSIGAGRTDRWYLAGTAPGGVARILRFDGLWLGGESDLPTGGVRGLYVSPHDEDVVLATMSLGGPAVYRSSDGGVSFSPVEDLVGVPANDLIAFDPLVPGRLVYEDLLRRPWWSEDDGATFTLSPVPWPGFVASQLVVLDPFVPGRILRRAIPGGVQVSDDGGETWGDVPALPSPLVTQVWLDPVGRGVGLAIVAGEVVSTGDGFATVTDQPLGLEVLDGDVTVFSVDPDDGALVLGTSLSGAWRVTGVAPYQDLGGGTEGTGEFVPRHFGDGMPELGGPWGLGVDRAVGGATGVMFFGLGDADLSLVGGVFRVESPFVLELPFVTTGVAGAAGAGTFEVSDVLPFSPLLVGTRLVTQVALLDPTAPGPFDKVLSNGLHTTFR